MKRLLAAIRFLTILPIPGSWGTAEADLAGSVAFFPVVGLLLGAIAAAAAWGIAQVAPPMVAAALVIVLLLSFSGCLHLDGLADTADGFLSCRRREQILEIMKDSRVGSMGLVVVTCVLLVKFAALASLPPARFWPAVLFAPLAGRAAICVHLACCPRPGPMDLGPSFAGLGTVWRRWGHWPCWRSWAGQSWERPAWSFRLRAWQWLCSWPRMCITSSAARRAIPSAPSAKSLRSFRADTDPCTARFIEVICDHRTRRQPEGIGGPAGRPVDELLDFSASINPLGPPECLREVLGRGIEQLVNYPDPDCVELVAAIAAHDRVPRERIVVGNGSSEILFALARACDGDRAVIPVPSYIDYAAAVRQAGKEVTLVTATGTRRFRP